MIRLAVLSLAITCCQAVVGRADYLYFKVDLTQLEELLKPLPMPSGPATPFNPGGGMPSPMPMPMPMAVGEQPNFPSASAQSKWLMGWVELKSPFEAKKAMPLAKREKVGEAPKVLFLASVAWGSPQSKTSNQLYFPFYANVDNPAVQYSASTKELTPPIIPIYSPAKEFEKKFKLKTERKPEVLEEAAYWAIERGLLSEFHTAMKGLRDTAPKSPLLVNYQRVKDVFVKDFKKVNLPDDPSWKALQANLSANGYRSIVSDHGRYLGLSKLGQGQDAQMKRRLSRLEDLTEQFYYWCAMQPGMPQLTFPKYKTLVVLASNLEDYQGLLQFYGKNLTQGDSVAPRRHNVILLSNRRLDRYADVLEKLQEKFKEKGLSRDEDLVQGDVWRKPGAVVYSTAPGVATLQLLATIHKQMEEEWEASHLTHEGMKQILLNSEFLPRNVVLPEWILEGLAGYFETPPGSLSSGAGRTGFSNLTMHKFYRRERQLGQNAQVLYNVVTDKYFRDADLLALKDPEKAAELREIGRVMAWSFLFHLLQERTANHHLAKLDVLLAYRDQLHALPRDLDLDDSVYQRIFADAFGLGKEPLAKNKGVSQLADAWFDAIPNQSLDIPMLETEYLAIRALDAREKKPATPGQ